MLTVVLSVLRRLPLALALVLLSGNAYAQDVYPEKPVTLVVGFSAGGGADTYARTLASLIHETLGVPMVVVNKPGAAGMIGAKFAAGQRPDGYTLYHASAGSLLVKALYDGDRAAVDPLADFRFLAGLGELTPGLIVPASSPFQTAAELVEYAKQHPDRLRWSHPGRGSLHQLAGSAFLNLNGISAQDVPFKGGSKARNAVAAEQVDFGFMGVQLISGFDSKLRALGVSADQRDAINQEVPTFAEQGLEYVQITTPQIVLAPKDLPETVAVKLTEAIRAATELEGFRKILAKAGLPAQFTSPEQAYERLNAMRLALQPLIAEVRDAKSD